MLLAGVGRARLAQVPTAVKATLRRARPLRARIEEYPPTFVDRRHLADPQADVAPPHGTDGLEVSADYYREHPPG